MFNKDKVRGILRARNGSQILKFAAPASPLPKPNPNILGSMVPTPDATDIQLSNTSPIFTGNKTKLMLKNAGKLVIQGAKDFLKLNGALITNMGLDMLGNSFNNVENSGTVDTAFLIGDIIGNYIPQVKFLTTAFKGIDSIGGKRSREFATDLATAEQVGGSYGGSMADITKAASKSGKKYGLFSGGSRRKANRLMDEAERLQNIMIGIANDARDMLAMAGNDFNYLNYDFDLMGGYDLRYMRAAKSGMKLLDKINFIKQRRTIHNFINLDTKEVDWEPVIEFKEGGSLPELWEPEIELFEEWEPVIDIFQKGGKTRTLEELIEYAKKENPRFIQRLSEEPKGIEFTDDEGNEGEGSHYLEWSTDDFGNAVIYPRIQEIEDGSLKFFPSNEAYLRAVKTKNMLIMSPEEANTFFSEDSEYKTAYKRGWPNFFKLFKDGGKTKEELETPEIEETNQKNLIPEGALHKNKHHMEHTEGLTLKGIPVIDNSGEQQAEIELDEIIFTLEVTKKLEELYKEGTDEAAIEAGKLLVKEILFNTDDRTGLIIKCEKGGKL